MKEPYSVRQLNRYMQQMFEQDFLLRHVAVRGEVSNLKYHSSGHIYFSLKEEKDALACVMFASKRNGLSFLLEDGMQITAEGGVSFYARDGRIQLYAEKIEQAGRGKLLEEILARKEKLAAKGYFLPEHKKKIPAYAQRIGVVTAPTGAAIWDIVNVAKRRNPYVQLILSPALVQGDGAAQSIARAIARLTKEPVDLMIVGRGGGSFEDLAAFNEEAVAEAIYACPIPVISAVGHETDTSIADEVADLRAPTPSAAAELAVFSYQEFTERLSAQQRRLQREMQRKLLFARERAARLEKRFLRCSPENRLIRCRQETVYFADRLQKAMQIALIERRHRFSLLRERLEGNAPAKKLSAGYSYTQDAKGRALKSVAQVEPGDALRIRVTDGVVCAVVTGKEP